MENKEITVEDFAKNVQVLEMLVEIGQLSKFLQWRMEDFDPLNNSLWIDLINSNDEELSNQGEEISEIVSYAREALEELESRIYDLFFEMPQKLGYRLGSKDEVVKI